MKMGPGFVLGRVFEVLLVFPRGHSKQKCFSLFPCHDWGGKALPRSLLVNCPSRLVDQCWALWSLRATGAGPRGKGIISVCTDEFLYTEGLWGWGGL